MCHPHLVPKDAPALVYAGHGVGFQHEHNGRQSEARQRGGQRRQCQTQCKQRASKSMQGIQAERAGEASHIYSFLRKIRNNISNYVPYGPRALMNHTIKFHVYTTESKGGRIPWRLSSIWSPNKERIHSRKQFPRLRGEAPHRRSGTTCLSPSNVTSTRRTHLGS